MGFLSKITDSIGLTDSEAGDRAAKAQGSAAALANKTLREMYDEGKERSLNVRTEGDKAFSSLADLANNSENFSSAYNPMRDSNGVFTMNDFQEDPGYKFRMAEGQKALERSAAAKGNLGGGASMKALARFGQNLASEEYGNAYNRFNNDYNNSYNRFNQDQSNQFNRLNTITNYGQNANNALTGQGMQMAQSIAGNQIGVGNANASAEMSKGNTMKDLLSSGISAAAMFCWVARAVFGETNPKWRDARNYILNIGPVWFRNLYEKHGEEFAVKVKKHKALRILITPLFEYFAFRGRLKASRTIKESLCA